MSTNYQWSDLWSGDRARAAQAANRLFPAWVSLVIVILIGWQIAKVAWMLVPGTSTGEPVMIPRQAAELRASADAVAASETIAGAHLFGTADASDAPAAPVEELDDLAETNLRNLTLRGTIASDRREFSIAIIANSGNEEKVYAVGDAVASGASLHAVYADRVVLNENGELTNLSLPREFANTRSTAAVRPVTYSQTDEVQEQDQSIQAVVAQNVSRLADVIRPTPYFVNGEQQGYRVYPGRNREQFAALGLRPGDLIREIDGQSLSDPTQAMQIFQSLGTASQVSVTVDRDGNPETIVLSTDQLDLGKEETQ